MDTVLIILYEGAILVCAMTAGMKFSEGKPVPACIYFVCAALWGVGLVLHIAN